ncbi:sigma-70 family RNA polymerase sigma factor [Chitinophaga sp. OAE865]|uniref:RNA polymerase sigma factor n=1 Tax=Chitinophaga sp. OAE865 TaxID=2817898 RepID=UPI001AE8EB06
MHADKLLEEQELLTLIENGDPKALEHIYLKFFGQLSYYAFKLVNDAEAAKDITSGILIKTAEQPKYFDSFLHLKNYLFLATRHASFRWLGQLKKEQLSLNELQLVGDDYDWQSEVEQIRARVAAAAHEQINLLPKGCAEVFRMIYFEGRDTAEVAKVLHISTKTVLNQKQTAVKLLRAALLKQGLLALFILFWGDL